RDECYPRSIPTMMWATSYPLRTHGRLGEIGAANGDGAAEPGRRRDGVAGVRNLTQVEAIERARLLAVTGYDITLELTDGTGGAGERVSRSTSRITFRCGEPGADTFIEVAAERIHSATLNGVAIDTAGWSPERGLRVPGLAAENELVVDADFPYSNSG